MKKFIAATAVFVVAYILFLAVNTPASLITKWADVPENIAISQLSGNIWQAQAEQVAVNDVAIHDVNLSLSPLSVLLLSPEIKTKFGGGLNDGPSGKGDITINSNTIVVNDAVVEMPAALIAPYINAPIPVEAMGLVTITIEQLDYQQGTCTVAKGKVRWRNAAVSAFDQQVELGDFSGQLSCDNQLLTLTLDEKNDLGLSFAGQLAKNNQVVGRGYVKPGQSFPSQLRDLLSFIGKPDSQGRYLVKL